MSLNSEPGQGDPRQPIGFHMEVTLISGIPEVEQTRFQRNLEDYLSGRGIAFSLTQWMGAVWNDDTDLTLADQCDLLSWLHAQPYVGAAVVSELKAVDGIEDVEGTQLRMEVYSVASIAGCVLYRLGLIKPEVFAQVLGGFVVPHYGS
jgi:hypothetical protein